MKGYRMRHFLVLHNEEKVGRAKHEDFLASSSKSFELDKTDRIWLIVGRGSVQKDYLLWKTFIYDNRIESNDSNDEHRFKYVGSYKGKMFCPPIRLNDLNWFTDFKQAMASFIGMREITDDRYILELSKFLSLD